MPFLSRSMFEKHQKLHQHQHDDDLHVRAISNPEEAAHIAALKLVMNTNLRSKINLLDTENKNQAEYLKVIFNQKNSELLKRIMQAHLDRMHGSAHVEHFILGRSL